MAKNQAAVEMGRKGGSVRSEAKKASGRKNVAKALAARLAKVADRKETGPVFKDGMPDVGVVGIARLMQKLDGHDPKKCRVYKCGLCAVLKEG